MNRKMKIAYKDSKKFANKHPMVALAFVGLVVEPLLLLLLQQIATPLVAAYA